MLGINTSVMVQKLNMSSSCLPSMIEEEIFCLRERKGHSKGSPQVFGTRLYQGGVLPRMVGQHSDGKKGKWQIKDVRRLHRPQ